MFGAKTLFHELLHLIKNTLSDEIREHFYYDLLNIVGKHGIKLHFLEGEDHMFDKAFERFKDRNE